ncbi:MAG: hypothetical protein HY908_30000 [Myxococcales bacterium]|nr:hypothetical protein [Myxococcales bacterium]
MPKPATRRPFVLALALVVLALAGAFGSASGCSAVSYLRGAQSVLPEPGHELPAVLRLALVRERVRLEALAAHHRVAFPLSVGNVLLGGLLLAASVGALAGRGWGRNLALQAIGAAGVFAVVEFAMLGPVRAEVARAVGREAAATEPGHGGDDQAAVEYARLAHAAEWGRFLLFEIVVLGGAALALTRPRARAFYAARAREAGTAEE